MTDEYTTTVPALSLLALGAEKLLKLTIGLARRDQGHAWPDKSYTRST
jgi:hypothetical protein